MIDRSNVTMASDGARTFNAYLSRPDEGRNPGIVVLHDMFGLNDPIRGIADRCADRGFAALVPNLFWRSANPDEIPYDTERHPEAWERLKALDLDVTTQDITTTVAGLRGREFCNGKVGVIGFCGGGRLAFLAAARSGVDAAASLYGLGISEHLNEVGNITCPLQLHYGLQDQHVPKTEVRAVSAGVSGRQHIAMVLYPAAGHSFANPARPTFDAESAALAWLRIDRMMETLR
jgi:carboxymethylenebutenolidase